MDWRSMRDARATFTLCILNLLLIRQTKIDQKWPQVNDCPAMDNGSSLNYSLNFFDFFHNEELEEVCSVN